MNYPGVVVMVPEEGENDLPPPGSIFFPRSRQTKGGAARTTALNIMPKARVVLSQGAHTNVVLRERRRARV